MTKQQLTTLKPIGDTGEIQLVDVPIGSQRTHSTCLTRKGPSNRKALTISSVIGKGSMHLHNADFILRHRDRFNIGSLDFKFSSGHTTIF